MTEKGSYLNKNAYICSIKTGINNIHLFKPSQQFKLKVEIMDRNKEIKSLVTKVLFRILLFLVYYIGLICLGLAIIAGIAYISITWLPEVLIAMSSLRLIILGVIFTSNSTKW